MRKLVLLSLLFSAQVFAYEMHMSCFGPETELEVWSFTGGKKVEIKVNGLSFEATKESYYQEKSQLSEYSFLEKLGGIWQINKYWIDPSDDQLKVQNTVELSCQQTEY